MASAAAKVAARSVPAPSRERPALVEQRAAVESSDVAPAKRVERLRKFVCLRFLSPHIAPNYPQGIFGVY